MPYWFSSIDYEMARAIYDSAGVELDLPQGHPTRFLHVYLDFMYHKKTTKWAHLLGFPFDNDDEDYYIGRFCRTSMRFRGDQLLDLVAGHSGHALEYWEYELYDYAVEEERCHVHEVSEALLCLLGMNATDVFVAQWGILVNESAPDIQEMLAVYQQLLLPDLATCLARRSSFISRMNVIDGLHALTMEIASNFSLDPHNRAGENMLLATRFIGNGFTDISGAASGQRKIELSGTADIEMVRQPTALHPGLEPLRTCFAASLANMSAIDCIRDLALIIPGFHHAFIASSFIGALNTTKRYEFLGTQGVIALHRYSYASITSGNVAYVPLNHTADAFGFEDSSIAYNEEVDRPMLLEQFPNSFYWRPGQFMMSRRCFVRDECFSVCENQSHESGIYFAYEDEQQSCTALNVPSIMGPRGAVDKLCYGIGTGNSSIVFTAHPDSIKYGLTNISEYVVNATADPFSFLACVVGGRIGATTTSSDDLPLSLLDLVDRDQPARVIIAQSFMRGTEEIFLNFYSLLALVGCIVFAVWVATATWQMGTVVHEAKVPTTVCLQLLHSMLRTSVAVLVWERGLLLLRCFGFVGIIGWYVGASQTKCTWYVGDDDLWSQGAVERAFDCPVSPTYTCHPGVVLGPLKSWTELLRLHAAAYTVFVMTFSGDCARGLTRTAWGFTVGLFLLGLVPTLVIASLVTALNQWRLQNLWFTSVHNQLFVTAIWLVVLSMMRLLRRRMCDRLATPLRWLRVHRQTLVRNRALQRVIGDFYFVPHDECMPEHVAFVPLSVCLEACAFEIEYLDIASHVYNDHKDEVSSSNSSTSDRLERELTAVLARRDQHQEYFVWFT